MRLLVDFLCISSSPIFFFTWIMNEIKYCSLDLKMKMVFFPLHTTPLILPIICFIHSCIIMVACIRAQLVHSGSCLLSVNLDNPISWYPGSSCICILHCAIPVFLCIYRSFQVLGFLVATNDLGTRSECENVTKNPFKTKVEGTLETTRKFLQATVFSFSKTFKFLFISEFFTYLSTCIMFSFLTDIQRISCENIWCFFHWILVSLLADHIFLFISMFSIVTFSF